MIWFDATQSDHPAMTWISSSTSLPRGSTSRLPRYVKPALVRICLAADGLYVAIVFARALTFLSVTHFGNSPCRPMASVGGAYPYSPIRETVLRSIARLSALRNAGMLYGYFVLSNMSETG